MKVLLTHFVGLSRSIRRINTAKNQ